MSIENTDVKERLDKATAEVMTYHSPIDLAHAGGVESGPPQPVTMARELYQSEYMKKMLYNHAMVVVVAPFIGLVAALLLAARDGIGIVEISTFVVMYTLIMIGGEVGYHRHFTHRSFQAKPLLRGALAILGCMTAQGPVIYWAAVHRCHHAHSDKPGDIHSPNLSGKPVLGTLRGLWHAHVGWMFNHAIPNSNFYSHDLVSDPMIRKINQLYYTWVAAGLAIPALVVWSLSGTLLGAFKGFLWGGLVRMFFLNHFTWSVNSICHIFGMRPFDTHEDSTNNFWLWLPTFGQSWHNNHHAFPYSAVMGLKWWQLDPGTWFLRLFEKLGLVWDIRVPAPETIAKKERKPDTT